MTDDCTIPFLLEDRDRLLEEIEKRDIRISELERATWPNYVSWSLPRSRTPVHCTAS